MAEWEVKPTFVAAFYGTSLTTGRLSTFWVEYLAQIISSFPECVGPFVFQNMGKGSQTSVWGKDNAYAVADLDPDYIWSEGFAINDCALVSGSPQVSRANHLVNMQAMHDTWKAKNPAVVITWQTMNPVSSGGEALRPDLALYYGDEVTKAAAMGDRMLNHYNDPLVPPGQSGGWQKPLALNLTDNSDTLHPTREATDIWLIPNILFDVRKAMADFWGLAAPTPVAAFSPLEIFYEVVDGGGGGGGNNRAAGGAAGNVRTGSCLSIAPTMDVVVGKGGLGGQTAGADGQPGSGSFVSGLNTGNVAPGAPGVGGPGVRQGKDGGSGGGGAGNSGSNNYGLAFTGTGNIGGRGYTDSGGGGGGKGGPGQGGQGWNTGQGGPGVASTVPGQTSVMIAAGGPGTGTSNRPTYLAGAGPSSIGGGGAAGGPTPSTPGPGDNGGDGRVTLWYAGPQRANGGVVTTVGGFTIHTFLGDAALVRYA